VVNYINTLDILAVMVRIDISMIVHAQKNPGSESFCYIEHPDIDNIGKLIVPENTVNIYAPCFGEPMFPAAYKWVSDNSGRFDPESINRILSEKGANPEEVTHLNIQLLGGEFTVCLLGAFNCITKWEASTHYLNRTTVRLPAEGVFDERGEKYIPLTERLSDPFLTADLAFFHGGGFLGHVVVGEEGINFHYKKRPWGVYDSGGSCILPFHMDTVDHEEKEGVIHMLTDMVKGAPAK